MSFCFFTLILITYWEGGRTKLINLNLSGISPSNSYLFYGSILSLELKKLWELPFFFALQCELEWDFDGSEWMGQKRFVIPWKFNDCNFYSFTKISKIQKKFQKILKCRTKNVVIMTQHQKLIIFLVKSSNWWKIAPQLWVDRQKCTFA